MFITFEGIDGSGKSTQARRLAGRVSAMGRECLLVREPGGTDLSERVRELLLLGESVVDPVAELLLFSAARAQLVSERIRPALARGAVVVCDRFHDSTTAYQGGGRGIAGLAWIRTLHALVTGGLVPDRTYLLDVPVHVAVGRRSGRASDRMEESGLEFLRRVAAAYREIAAGEPGRVRVVDGTSTEDSIAEAVWEDFAACRGGTAGVPSGTDT